MVGRRPLCDLFHGHMPCDRKGAPSGGLQPQTQSASTGVWVIPSISSQVACDLAFLDGKCGTFNELHYRVLLTNVSSFDKWNRNKQADGARSGFNHDYIRKLNVFKCFRILWLSVKCCLCSFMRYYVICSH